MKIRITEGPDRFFAYIEGNGAGAHGDTPGEALLELIGRNRGRFNISEMTIQYRLPFDREDLERTSA